MNIQDDTRANLSAAEILTVAVLSAKYLQSHIVNIYGSTRIGGNMKCDVSSRQFHHLKNMFLRERYLCRQINHAHSASIAVNEHYKQHFHQKS